MVAAQAVGMNASTSAPVLLLAAACLVACGGPDPSDEALESARVVAAPSGPSGASGGGPDWWAIYDVLLDSVWDVVCDQWEVIRQGGVHAFCEAYLDSIDVPRRGLRRTIARSVCVSKVNRAIDEAICTISEHLHGPGGTSGPSGPSGSSGPSGPPGPSGASGH